MADHVMEVIMMHCQPWSWKYNVCMVDHGHGSAMDAWLTMVMEVQWMHG